MKQRTCPSVGAIVKNKRGEYLVLYRLKEPVGLALPAGHIEKKEDIQKALERELFEETGLRAKKLVLRLCRVLKNTCSRGAKKHRWYVFDVLEYSGKPKRKEKKKHSFVKFMRPQRIREYLKNSDVDPAWIQIFEQLKIINRKPRH